MQGLSSEHAYSGHVQFCSSELSPQSSTPSQTFSLLVQLPFLHWYCLRQIEQFRFSSELSPQSSYLSQTYFVLIQFPIQNVTDTNI